MEGSRESVCKCKNTRLCFPLDTDNLPKRSGTGTGNSLPRRWCHSQIHKATNSLTLHHPDVSTTKRFGNHTSLAKSCELYRRHMGEFVTLVPQKMEYLWKVCWNHQRCWRLASPLKPNARRGKLPLYLLINLLHQESCLVSLRVRLVSEKNWNGSNAASTKIYRPKFSSIEKTLLLEKWAADSCFMHAAI